MLGEIIFYTIYFIIWLATIFMFVVMRANTHVVPRKSFIIPNRGANKLNRPAFRCMNCERIIYEENFYNCPNRQCMVQVKWTPDQIKAIEDRNEKNRLIHELQHKLKNK